MSAIEAWLERCELLEVELDTEGVDKSDMVVWEEQA